MKKRETELDLLRWLALLAVISIHANGCGPDAPASYGTMLSGMFALSTWCVPVFFMISGRFFLDPEHEIPMRKLYGKYILRIVTAFCFWSAVYQIYYLATGAYAGLNWKGVLTQYVEGAYHMWFLYAIAGLYMLTPILRRIAADEKVSRYYLLLFFVFSFLTGYAGDLPGVGGILSSFTESLGMKLVLGYSGYFLLGYTIWNMQLSKRTETAIYALGVCALAFTCLAALLIDTEDPEYFVQYLKPNVILSSAAIFTFFTKRVSHCRFSERVRKMLAGCTRYGFGVYLIHALVNEFVGYTPFSADMFVPVLALPLVVLVIYGVSLVLAMAVRRIPVIGKWIA